MTPRGLAPNAKARVTVVIPTRESAPGGVLGDAIRSVRAQRGAAGTPVIVVGDGVVPPALESDAATRAVATKERGGFAAAVNRGIDQALGEGAEFVLLLNDDALLREDALDKLLASADARLEHAMFSPKIVYPGEPPRLWWAGGDYATRAGVPRHFGRGRRDAARYSSERPISFATGCALLVRRSAFEKVGRYSLDYVAYGEDIDFSIRARRAGLSILYVPDAVVVHRVEEAGRRREGEPWRIRLATANLLRLISRYSLGMDRVTALAWFSLRWVAYLAARSIVRRDRASLGAVFGGIADYRKSPLRAGREAAP